MQHLVWYNTKRPHLSLDLKSPLQYVLDNDQNSRMWWTSTLNESKEIILFSRFIHLLCMISSSHAK
ncbi:MAG: hypothetical protein HC932_06130 [Thermales bacterium]|nr:hypothetical protein [Thermales bacterium]